MTRYVVSSDEGSGFSVDQLGSSGEYQMSIARWVTEAQAQIIAFALNAVAEGQLLMIGTHPLRTIHQGNVPGQSRHVIFYVGDAEVYDGPTEGVA